jgi:hypothetical protein
MEGALGRDYSRDALRTTLADLAWFTDNARSIALAATINGGPPRIAWW